MNLLKFVCLITVVAFSITLSGCLKSNCTDQVKNPELFGIWYYYKVGEIYRFCDSTDSKGNSFSYRCLKLRLEKVQYQFSSEKFIVKAHSDTAIDTSAIILIDPDVQKLNEYWFYSWGYNVHSADESDWFTDNNKLLICENNSMCFENECNVYAWKIENGKLFLQNHQTSYVLTREDLFEKIRNSIKVDRSK